MDLSLIIATNGVGRSMTFSSMVNIDTPLHDDIFFSCPKGGESRGSRLVFYFVPCLSPLQRSCWRMTVVNGGKTRSSQTIVSKPIMINSHDYAMINGSRCESVQLWTCENDHDYQVSHERIILISTHLLSWTFILVTKGWCGSRMVYICWLDLQALIESLPVR